MDINEENMKLSVIMITHFPKVRAGDVKSLKCSICEDFIHKHCGGEGLTDVRVLDCMRKKIALTKIDFLQDNLQ